MLHILEESDGFPIPSHWLTVPLGRWTIDHDDTWLHHWDWLTSAEND